ncbi:hypothetical protein OSB04_021606 [Centaurea solstitialis]|uniref:Apyrase 6 n=1 Tax=Centaurea solstitialis TaxID=347529 RepID=A0AA38T282_9ASTR|nr:hypothetical protein OSB04_021606 [Centaurea solstitialis]
MRRSNARVAASVAAVDHSDLTTDNSNKMNNPMIKLKFRPDQLLLRSTNLFSRNHKQHHHSSRSKILLVVFLILVFITSCYLYLNWRSSMERRYRIVIDGGSTGSRIHVFEYVIEEGSPVLDFGGKKGLGSMRVSPGLSAFAEHPEGAGESLLELLMFARERVPEKEWGKTEVRLMATAGLRILDLGVQELILESCRNVLRVSRFEFRDGWASVISGSDEGVYAWVVANYALGTLGGDPEETTGIIELGGASAQVTFVSREPIPAEFSQKVKFGKLTYNLYSHSLLHFGQNIAFDLLQESIVANGTHMVDPCSPKGYEHDVMTEKLAPTLVKNEQISNLHASGNFSECISASLSLLQKGKDECAYEKCYIGSTFIPKLEGKFLATENFFHTSKFFGLSPRTFLSEMKVAGQKFCEDDWSNIKMKYPGFPEEDLHRYCFSSAYIVALLHHSLGIALDDDRIGYANKVNDVPLDWALGAFILQSAGAMDVDRLYPTGSTFDEESSSSTTLLGLLAFVFLLLFAAYFVSKWRNPEMKTIYDLEKGKYIVTRVAR